MIGRFFVLAALVCLLGVPLWAQSTGSATVSPTPDMPLLSQQAPGDVPPALMPPPPPPPPSELPVPAPVQPPPTQLPPGPAPAKTQAEATPTPAAPTLSPSAPVLEPPPPPSGFVLPASAQITNSTTPAATPMPSPLMPPPPPSGFTAVPSSPSPTPTSYQNSPLAMPAPPVVPTVAAPSMSPMVGGLQKIDARLAKQLRHLIYALAAIRELPDKPANDGALRLLLGSGGDVARILGLARFPVLPRFQSRSDETVVRNRSYDSWEYRFFGAFQTRLNGWVKPQALEVRADLRFDGRRKSWVRVTAAMTRLGQMTGRYTVQGSDNWGRLWNLAIEMQSVQLHDDGLPSGGTIKISGVDPLQKSMSLLMRFPCEVVGEPLPSIDKRKAENRVSR